MNVSYEYIIMYPLDPFMDSADVTVKKDNKNRLIRKKYKENVEIPLCKHELLEYALVLQ